VQVCKMALSVSLGFSSNTSLSPPTTPGHPHHCEVVDCLKHTLEFAIRLSPANTRARMCKRRPDPHPGPRFHVRITWALPAASRRPVRSHPLAPPPPCRWPGSVASHCRKRGMRTDLMAAQTSRMSLW
jgi:hypothetical protein